MSVLVSVWLITCCDQNYNTPLLNDKIGNCVVTLKLCDYVLMFVNRLSTTIWALVGPGRRNIVVGGEAGTGERWGRLEIFLRSLLLSLERVYPAVTSCSVARRPTGERWVFMLAWEVIAPTPSLTCVNYYLVSFSQETSSLSAFISLMNLLPCTHIYLFIDWFCTLVH